MIVSLAPTRFAAILFLAFGLCFAGEQVSPAADATTLTAEGLLGLATGASICMQESHILTDPCTGFEGALLDQYASTVPLDGYLCQYVSVTGPDVGVECPIIGVQAIIFVQPPACLSELVVSDSVSTWLQWPVRPCAFSYDMIRGLLPGPGAGAGSIDLGAVRCLVNDLDASGATPSTLTGPHDEEIPPPGQAFFYLVRATLQSSGVTPYGFSSAGVVEAPTSGDCGV